MKNFSNTTTRFALGALAALTLSTGLSAQTFLRPHNPARVAQKAQNGWIGGQPSDLEFTIKNVQFVTQACPGATTKQVLTQAKIDIEIDWTLAKGMFGINAKQAEDPIKTSTVDKWVLMFKNEGNRWTRNNMVGPGGIGPGINGGAWTGQLMTVPANFETGQAGKLSYTLTLDYNPQNGDPCLPKPLAIKGHYVHSYDGDLHIFQAPTVTMQQAFPWALIVGNAWLGGDDHAWLRALGGGGWAGKTRVFRAPANTVAMQACCPLPGNVSYTDFTEPSYALNGFNDLSPIQRGDQRTCSVFFNDEASGVSYVQMDVLGASGESLGSTTTSFDPPCYFGCEETADINLPQFYEGETLTVVVQIADAEGNINLLEVPYEVSNPLPQITSTLTGVSGDANALHFDPSVSGGSYQLHVEIYDPAPETDLSYVSNRIFVHLMEGSQLNSVDIVHLNTGMQFTALGGGRYSTLINVVDGGVNSWFDNVLNAKPGQRIHVAYQMPDNNFMESIFQVSPSASAVQTYSSEVRPGVYSEIGGTSTGGLLWIDIDGMAVATESFPGQSGAAVANTLVTTINSMSIAGVSAFNEPNGGVRVEGGSSVVINEFGSGLFSTVALPLPLPIDNGTPNSTGSPSAIDFIGTPSRSQNEFSVTVDGLPQNQIGMFIVSPQQANIPMGNGTLGLSPNGLLRLQVRNAGAAGSVSFPLDLQAQFPSGVQFLAGSNWFVQFWHRDVAAGGAGFDFSPTLDVIVHP